MLESWTAANEETHNFLFQVLVLTCLCSTLASLKGRRCCLSIKLFPSVVPPYTMFAFHQWGFSSGWEDRIPVPADGHKETRNIQMTVCDFRGIVGASCKTSDHTENKHPWWKTLAREVEGTFLNLPLGRFDIQNLIHATDEACLEASCSTEETCDAYLSTSPKYKS